MSGCCAARRYPVPGPEAIRVAVAGNPNSGKSTLINVLAGSRLQVGNWPGVTVERKEASFEHGGRTILPHRAAAKIDLRLVPDMTFDGAVAALKAHLAKRGYGDIEVNVTGGYDPTSSPARGNRKRVRFTTHSSRQRKVRRTRRRPTARKVGRDAAERR